MAQLTANSTVGGKVIATKEELTTHEADSTKHLTNGFLKINNGSTNFLLKMDAEGLYLEEV